MIARWLIFLVLYLAFAGQLSLEECTAALLCATAATALSARLARLASHDIQVRPPWLSLLRSTAASLAHETILVATALLNPRPLQGATIRQPFSPGPPKDAGRRGVALLALSMAPNGIVLDPAAPGGTLALHRLVPSQPPSPERHWPP